MASKHSPSEQQEKGRRLLRVTATASATVGIVLNLIAFLAINQTRRWHHPRAFLLYAFLPLLASLAWNILNLCKSKPRQFLQITGDALAFCGFLVILIANGCIATSAGLSMFGTNLNRVMLLAYNSMPWIVCAAMHLGLAFYSLFFDFAKFNSNNWPRIRIEWPESRSHGTIRLPADEEYHDAQDVEAQSTMEDISHQEQTEEARPLLSSS